MTTVAAPDGRPSPTLTARGRAVLAKGVLGIVVDPVRKGRMRVGGLGPGMRGVVMTSVALYVVLVTATLGAGWLRRHSDLTYTNGFSSPRLATLLVLVAVVWCTALLVTGALHAAAWVRVGVLVVAVPLVLNFGYGTNVWSANRLTTYGAALALVALTAVVWRRPPAAWEFPVVLVVVTVGVLVPLHLNSLTSRSLGFEIVDTLMSLQVQRLGQLALPATALAGIAGVQLAISTADRAVTVARGGARLVLPVVLVLGLARLAITVPTLGERSPDTGVTRWGDVVGAVLLLVLGALALRGLQVLARDVARATPDDAAEEMGRLGLPIAAGMLWTVVPLLVLPSLSVLMASYAVDSGFTRWLSDLTTTIGSPGLLMAGRVALTVVLVAFAVRWARAQRLLPAVIAGETALTALLVYSGRLSGGHLKVPVSPAMVVEVASCAAVVAIVVLRLRGRLSATRLGALGSFVILAWAFALGDLLGSPITTILGLSGVSLSLYGLIWSFLTGAGDANEGSGGFPRPSRVLIYLANAVFAMAVVAYGVLVRSATTAVVTVSDPSQIGLQVLGTALVLTAAALLLRRVVADVP